MKALYANDKKDHSLEEMEQALAELQATIRGSRIRLYFQEGEETLDQRVIDPNAINFDRPPPFALRLITKQSEAGGHAGAELCGVIEKVMRDGLTIVAEGRLDLNSAAGQEAERLIREKILQTWSPDLGKATIDLEENVEDEDGNTPQEVLAHFVKATFNGGTLVPMPALASAVVELLDDSGNVVVPALKREHAEPTEAVGESHEPDEHKHIVQRVAACAGPATPPASFFTNPKLTEPQRYISITPDGRVFGHLACWGECHIGYRDVCVEPPRGGSYSYFHVGQVKTDEGQLIATGPLTLKGGHAGRGLSASQAQAHYDDTRSAIADVVLFEDDHGIAFSGALRPDVTDEQIRIFRASGVSGDWRRIGDSLELIGATSVNIPGFPKVRLVASSEEDEPEILALVAAGGAPEPALTDDCGCSDCDEDDELTLLKAQVSRLESIIETAGIDVQALDSLESEITA